MTSKSPDQLVGVGPNPNMEKERPDDNEMTLKAVMDEESACSIVHDLYGMRVKNIRELNGYDDRNFHVQVEDAYENPHLSALCHSGYTLKVINKLDSDDTDFLDTMDSVLLHCREQNLEVPVPIRNKMGVFWSKKLITDGNNGQNLHVIRLFSYLPGETIYHLPYTASILYQWGKLLANFHQSVKNFPQESLKKRNPLWSLKSVPKILDYLFCIEIEERRCLIKKIVKSFKNTALQEIESLPTGIIHGDFNEHNILVRKIKEEYEVYGILDFGDLHIAPVIFDVAIMLTYAILECKTMNLDAASGHALAGYSSIFSLTEKEYKIIKICVLARLSQSLVLGAYTFSLDPSNEYALSSSRMGWNVLYNLWKIPDDELNKTWENIIKSYNK